MDLVDLVIRFPFMKHPHKWTITEMRHYKRSLIILIVAFPYSDTGASACSFWLAFLQRSLKRVLKFGFLLSVIPRSLSSSLSSIKDPEIFTVVSSS